MTVFLSTVPGIIITIGGIISVLVIGVLYVLGLWKKGKDDEDDRLIQTLKETVEALDKKFKVKEEEWDNQKKEWSKRDDELNTKIDTLTRKVGDLEHENETLVKVLQGRDEQTKKFYDQAFESMKVAQSTHEIVVDFASSFKQTNENMAKLIELLGKHVDVADHMVTGAN